MQETYIDETETTRHLLRTCVRHQSEIAKITSVDARDTAARLILELWGPESTSSWLVANPLHPLFDSGALQLVETLAKTDPEAAAV